MEKENQQDRNSEKKKSSKDEDISKAFLALLGLLVIIYAFNIFTNGVALSKISEKAAEIEEETRPAELNIIRLVDSECTDCFNLNRIVNSIKSNSLTNITSDRTIEYSSDEAKEWINKVGVRRIPALIITGEIEKENIKSIWTSEWNLQVVNGKGEWAYFTTTPPPYIDPDSKRIIGLVSLIKIVDSSCSDCWDPAEFANTLKSAGVVFSSERTIEYTSEEAQKIIDVHNVQRIPAVAISNDILAYDSITPVFEQLNLVDRGGTFALHAQIPPYRNMSTNKIVGRISVIYLDDNSCTDCYDVQVNKRILTNNFGMSLTNEESVDISSARGKELISKYNITKIPVIIVSPDAEVYPLFTEAWKGVGKVASDGWYVMTNPKILGRIKEIS